jgi:hypothetical protein
MRYEIRPLGTWTEPVTEGRPRSPFSATWTNTLDLLDRETFMLGCHLVVIQIDVPDGAIRKDGMLHARARASFPGVRVAFESHHGPLMYATDAFAEWQSNVRAIALGLEALRKVDRYGISRRGEQYRGFTAIGGISPEQAARDLIESYGGLKAAFKATHPDTGGSAEDFRKVDEARRLLGL